MATPTDKGRIVRDYGKLVDFGTTSGDYARFRPGPPAAMYDRLERFVPLRGRDVIDAGTGTGVVAIELAARGARVTAIDPSEGQLDAARALARARGLSIEAVAAFDRELAALLAHDYREEPLLIWHRVWVVLAPKP